MQDNLLRDEIYNELNLPLEKNDILRSQIIKFYSKEAIFYSQGS